MDIALSCQPMSAAAAAESIPLDMSPNEMAARLLDWYDWHRRRLPWRAETGEVADPYRVWLSEIMLQQTTVATVRDYFLAFTERWPTVHDLAAAPLDEVLAAWAGLGYYARARNLHACAKTVSTELDGQFPDNEEALRALPGIGAYTAAAIAAIAFDRAATVVDGNVERVMARLHAVTEPLPAAKPKLKALAAALSPHRRPGDYAQAAMDLGATICTPRKPKCLTCPWRDACRARARSIAEELPAKAPKKPKPTRRGIAFFLLSGEGQVLLRRRPEKGLLGGMSEVPSTPWVENPSGPTDPLQHTPLDGVEWTIQDTVVRHTFTHFHLELQVFTGTVTGQPAVHEHQWWEIDRLGEAALPTVMVKVVRQALSRLA